MTMKRGTTCSFDIMSQAAAAGCNLQFHFHVLLSALTAFGFEIFWSVLLYKARSHNPDTYFKVTSLQMWKIWK